MREEVAEWTRRLSEPPPSASAPHTRKLASSPPPAPELPSARPTVQRRTLVAFAAGAFAALAALVPVLVPARASAPDANAREPERRVPAPPPASVLTASAAPSVEPPAPAIGAASSAVSPAPAASRAPATSPASTSPSASTSVPNPRGSSMQRPALVANAALRLTADPEARVRVHGRGFERALTTPVRELRLPAGAYTVTFENVTYAAPVSAEVIVEEGGRRSVHADFREVVPRVSVR